MELFNPRFTAHNVDYNFEQPQNVDEYFTLAAPPCSNIWRNPDEDVTSAPMVLTCLGLPFILAEVTITADLDIEFDQAGLVLFANMTPNQTPPTTNRRRTCSQRSHSERRQQSGKWAKASVQLVNSQIGFSTVVTQPYCEPDWSYTPLASETTEERSSINQTTTLQIKLERVSQDLWMWYRIPNNAALPTNPRTPAEVSQEWRKAREVTGFFRGVEPKSGVYVGCYASRPMEDDLDDKSLAVEFEDLEIV